MTGRGRAVALRALSAIAIAAACGRGPAPAREDAAPRAGAPAQPPPAEAAADAPTAPAAASKASVTLWFPSATDDTLVAETREIVDTVRPADRGTQILTALIEGPKTGAALPALPAATSLRQLWIRSDGTAYADFSGDLAAGMTGGSEDEILAAYAIVESLASNIPSIRRVGILVDGREKETLGGHLDIRRPLVPDPKLRAGAPPSSAP